MKYRISKKAEKDLEEIWLYTLENWSLQQADYYYDLIIDEIEYLSANPKNGQDFSHIRKGYFRSKIKSHFIYYRLNLKNEELQIIKILHQRMDIDTQL